MYKQICPATDWFYIENHNNAIGIYYVAAWALTEDGVFGLISVGRGHRNDTSKCARLIKVPPTGVGMYKHKEELDKMELQALESDGYLEILKSLEKESV
ncbi:hypothetical protein [Legionella feeleii]|uniref:Uncharacterized protein n=1 Tax=Legionella feeleii TaxID=453 RepID=A0A378KJE1_9GAMM|nr:hypothetical protein [Legionella feeleii]STX88337.1 Uncharacterised protein [Legionella feeleii]